MKVYVLQDKITGNFIMEGDCWNSSDTLDIEHLFYATLFSDKDNAERRAKLYDAVVIEAELTLK